MNDSTIDISVVIPCLNEERTVSKCVEAALDGIRAAGLAGEVIVADNGSVDHSRERAAAAGARVIPAERKGYGAAVQAGFLAAQGRLLVMGDADLSYDFREIPKLVDAQRKTGADLVIGDRLGGTIASGAMPWSHRVIGNPLISATIRFFFGAAVNDCYCGLRLMTREAHRQLSLTATGMEYALEMIVLAQLSRMRFANVPITLHPDDRDRPPHLRTIRDGYRSFRFLFQHAPVTLYLAPGLVMIAAGLIGILSSAWKDLHRTQTVLEPGTIVAGGLLLVGWILILLGTVARMFAAGFLHSRVDPFLPRFFRTVQLEHAVSICVIGVLACCGLLACYRAAPSLLYLGVLGLVIFVGTLLGAFVVSLIGRAVPDNRFYPPAEAAPPAHETGNTGAPSAGSGQNEEHSLATQAALSNAHNYNQWLFHNVREACAGCQRLLDVGCSTGNLTSVVASEVAAKESRVKVVGLEPIAAAADIFRDRFSGRSDLEVIVGSITAPPAELVQAGPFDCALSFNVLEHIEDDGLALAQIGALLKPAGMLGIVVPAGGNALYGTLDALDCHYRRYTRTRLLTRLQTSGYDVVSMRYVNVVGYFLWFLKGRILRSRRFGESEVATFDRLVPCLRKIDSALGPPFGQSLAVVARWRG